MTEENRSSDPPGTPPRDDGDTAADTGDRHVPHRADGSGYQEVARNQRQNSSQRLAISEKQQPDRPILKEPVWVWSVPVYFYLGSTAGTAAALAAAAQSVDQMRFTGVVDIARKLSAAFLTAGSILLIHDLGRRARFLNMLRVFRPSSPMSLGSWLLASTTPLVVLSSFGSGSNSPLFRKLSFSAGTLSGCLGLPLAGYTGVLLGTTAIPVWQSMRTLLPPLFLSSGAGSATELIQLGDLTRLESKGLQRLALFFRSAELLLMLLVSRKLSEEPISGRPLKEGLPGRLWKLAAVLTIGGVCLHGWKRTSRRGHFLRAIAGVVGGVSLRFALLHAGRISSRNPDAVLEQQS